jgi:hypothetical protein
VKQGKKKEKATSLWNCDIMVLIIFKNSNSITNDQIKNTCMNLKYNRIDMNKRVEVPNCPMKLRKRPSTSKTQKPKLPNKHKPKPEKDDRLFGTDLTNQPRSAAVNI